MRFNPPSTWFGPGVGGPYAPKTWEGGVIFVAFLATPFILALCGVGS